jgi:hypothetical protein
VNVAIGIRGTGEVVARYEVHLADEATNPPDEMYFDEAWHRAVSERLVDPSHRERYHFHAQRPKTLYESSE